MVNTAVLFLGGADLKSLKYNEYFFPVQRILGFHLAPPAVEPLDFDPDEVNRTMLSVNLILGAFILKGLVRVSSNSDLTTMLERSHTNWLSVYDADISNLFLPQMPGIHVSMLLVNPTQVSFGL